MNAKRCSCCNEYKTFDRFSKNITAKIGLQSYCKDCATVKRQARPKKANPNTDMPTGGIQIKKVKLNF